VKGFWRQGRELERGMSTLTTVPDVDSTAKVSVLCECEMNVDNPAQSAAASDNCDRPPAIFEIEVARMSSPTPLPNDVLDLLSSAVRFAETVVQLDRTGPNYGAERLVFDALATMKQCLRQVAWSRALE
jgi:hypothetical protein